MIVAFVSQKGGVGKSTLSRGLAREAAANGLTVKIADLDTQQGTSIEWHRRRLNAGHEPAVAAEAFATAAAALKIAKQVELLIIDAPARASAGTLEIAKVADLVVQPTNPSLDDLIPAVREFHALVKAGIPRSKLVFALNNVLSDSEEAAAREYLAKAGYEALDGSLTSKTSYRTAQNEGRAITELSRSSLKTRADALIQSLINKAFT
jgi:chromosome partitioning protein